MKTPESPKYVPLTPRRQGGGTRKSSKKTKARKTAKKQGKTLYDVASSFHKVWASHGKK